MRFLSSRRSLRVGTTPRDHSAGRERHIMDKQREGGRGAAPRSRSCGPHAFVDAAALEREGNDDDHGASQS